MFSLGNASSLGREHLLELFLCADDGLWMAPDRLPGISVFLDAPENVFHVETLRVKPDIRQLVPIERRRNRRSRLRPYRIRSNGGLGVRVPQHIDIDASKRWFLRAAIVICSG
jgi:hypothetical protein